MNEAQATDRMRQVIRCQLKALATEDDYALWLRRNMKAFRHMVPPLSIEKKLETFLTELAIERDVSASTQNHPLGRLGDARWDGSNLKIVNVCRPWDGGTAPAPAPAPGGLSSDPLLLIVILNLILLHPSESFRSHRPTPVTNPHFPVTHGNLW
jgi:Phage integrase, N-terminal SAM-like domain